MTLAESMKSRRSFLAFVAALAVAMALATGLFDNGHEAVAAGHSHDHAARHARVLNAKQASFQDQMRKLWEDHVTWTRLAIVTFADGSPAFDATAARLMKNQKDIGDAIRPFYGKAAGKQLTALLQDHIGIAVNLLVAAKAGDQQAFDTANAAWYANADDIAGFLASADKKHWPRATMRAAMRAHLDQTLAEASHELGGDYAASVADYEEIHHHILQMADVLSTGIMRAFPKRFH
jgi:hypothetical protein